MDEIVAQTYSTKATAFRGAKRLGIKNPKVEQTKEGRWSIKIVKHAPRVLKQEPVATGQLQLVPIPVKPMNGFDLSQPESIVPKKMGSVETYSELEIIAPIRSVMAAPVAFVWAFLDLNPNMGRKEAVCFLVKQGCNINMSRSQYQLWKKAGGGNRKRE